ncbi:MAG: hypothetical protein Alpg2KO_06600 [Alphaproteobacteria bacterium]
MAPQNRNRLDSFKRHRTHFKRRPEDTPVADAKPDATTDGGANNPPPKKPLKVPATAAVTISATLIEILHDGTGSEPWRALGETPGGATVMLTARQALDLKPGDDFIGVGVAVPATDPNIPIEIFVSDPRPVGTRFKAMADPRAICRQFGLKPEHGKRPGAIAALKHGLKDLARRWTNQGRSNRRAETASSDPAIRWAAKMFRDLPGEGNIVVIDPAVLTTGESRLAVLKEEADEYLSLTDRWRNRRTLDRIRKRLVEALPTHLQADVDDALILSVLHGEPLNFTGKTDNPNGRNHRMSIVIPFGDLETGWSDFTGFAQLDASQFLPKRTLHRKFRRMVAIAHELAHGVQEEFGIELGGEGVLGNMSESFVDAFAALAVAKETRDWKQLRLYADQRLACMLCDDMEHSCGLATRAAVNRARAMEKAGKLDGMTTRDLLIEARRIASRHAISPADGAEIQKLKQDIFAEVGIDSIDGSVGIEDSVEAYRAIAYALGERPEVFGRHAAKFRATIKAIREISHVPGPKPDLEKLIKAVNSYETDLRRVTKQAVRDPADLSRMIQLEQERLFLSCIDLEPEDIAIAAKLNWDDEEERQELLDLPAAALFAARLGKIKPELEQMAVDAAEAAKKSDPQDEPKPGATVIRRAHRINHAVAAFAMPASRRMGILINTMKEESKALSDLLEDPDKPGIVGRASDLAQVRHDIAFAIRADSRCWAQFKRNAPKELMAEVVQSARQASPIYGTANALFAKRRIDSVLEASTRLQLLRRRAITEKMKDRDGRVVGGDALTHSLGNALSNDDTGEK